MQRTCPNCSSPLFDTDTICWHCGQQQSLPSQQTKEITAASAVEEESESQPEPSSPALILYFGFLMITIILALFLITSSLAQSPILAVNQDVREEDWISLTSPTKMFLIEMPATWNWHFQEEARTNSSFNELLGNDSQLAYAIMPLGALVPDIDYLLVAHNGKSLLVVTSSDRLNQLSARQAAAALQAESFDNLVITEARLLTSGTAEDRVSITLTHMDRPLKCNQRLVPAQSKTFLIAACASAENYSSQQELFKDVLDSFVVQAPYTS